MGGSLSSVRATCHCRPWRWHVGTLHPVSIFLAAPEHVGNAVKGINNNNPVLLDLAEQVSALKLQSQAGSREISLSGQLVMLTQRMAKNANALLASDVIDPEVTFLLGKDSNTFRDIMQGLTKGSDSLRIGAARDPEMIEKLKELDGAYGEYRKSVNSILGSLQPLVNAKAAGRSVVADSGFTRAALKGWKDALANPEEAAKIEIQYVKALNPEIVVEEIQILKRIAITPDVEKNGFCYISLDRMKNTVDFINKNIEVSGDKLTAEQIYRPGYLPETPIKP